MFHLILCLFTSTCVCIWLWVKQKHSYWKKRGVKGPEPHLFIGNIRDVIAGKQSAHEFADLLYQDFPEEKVVGYYQGLSPALVLRDPELIKDVIVVSNDSFNSRGMRHKNDTFDDNVFLAEGEKWRILRQKFNPAFTPSKLKTMFNLIDSCLETFLEHIDGLIASGHSELDMTEQSRLLALDINGSCCFGISMDVYSEKPNVFVNLSRTIFDYLVTPGLWRYMEVLYPDFVKFLSNWLNIEGPLTETTKIFERLIKDVVKQREGNVIKNNDLMDLLVKLKTERIVNNSKATVLMDDAFVVMHAMTFFIAGFEPSSAFLSLMIYEMALHEDIQQRLYEEVSRTANENGGKLTCDNIKNLTYLNMVFDEVMRIYGGNMTRLCTETCTFTKHNLTIEKGTTILIPLRALQCDPKHFNDPEVFDPERFSPENISNIPRSVYLPFGQGPRHCLGTQFGRMQCLMGAAGFFLKNRIFATARTPTKLTLNPLVLNYRFRESIWVGVERR